MMMQNLSEQEYFGRVLMTFMEITINEFSKEQNKALATYVSDTGDKKHKADERDVCVRLHWIIHQSHSSDWMFPANSGRASGDARTYAHELISTRNKCAHPPYHLDTGDAWRAADTAIRLLKVLGLSTDPLDALKQELPLSGTRKPSHPPDNPSSHSRDSTKKQIAVITCSKLQDPHAISAGELYTGPSFKLSVEEAKKDGLRFLIISTRDGLIHPEDPSKGTYDRDAKKMNEQEKQAWQEILEPQVKEKLCSAGIGKVVFLAGEPYRLALQPILDRHGIEYETHRNWKKVCQQVWQPQ